MVFFRIMSFRILIVEDVEEMLYLLENFIGGLEGFRVSGLARSGAEARRELTRDRPDLVLLDEILPGESSVELLTEIRAMGIPVVVMTSVENPVHELVPGAFGRLIKPGWRSGPQDQARFRGMFLAALGKS
ncbi:MAG: response regulator [Oligoflexia bacterium]|nr:response regulator [Oligoflexia bacterium]